MNQQQQINISKLDSIYHLSFDKKSGILSGAAVTKGTEGNESIAINTIDEGGIEHIKAGKFPVLFSACLIKDTTDKRHIKNNGNYKHRQLLNRVNGMLPTKKCKDSSSYAHGTFNNSE